MTSRAPFPLLLAYSLAAYATFLLAAAWSVSFLANGPGPTTVDGRADQPAALAVVVDLALLGAFALHHSVMARDGAKRILTRIVPPAAERSTYVVVASGLLALLLWQWQPVDGTVWQVSGEPGRALLWTGYVAGWVVVVAATFMIDHLDLFGIRQARAAAGGYVPPTFAERWLYAWVRHPLMLGFLIAFWCTPDMTRGHLLFAAAATGYIAVGVWLEERDLARDLGPTYAEYAARVPAIVPRPRRRAAADDDLQPEMAPPA